MDSGAALRVDQTRPATAENKIYVLDTNVLLHDPTSIMGFNEHRIFLSANLRY